MEYHEHRASQSVAPNANAFATVAARGHDDDAARLALLGQLVAGVAHDLRQPLTVIEMNVSAAIRVLSRPELSLGDALDALDDVLTQERRMRDALQMLEDFAARRAPLAERCNVVTVLGEAIAFLRNESLTRHVPIEVDVVSDVNEVRGEPTLVREALLDVLLAALEATSRDAPRGTPILVTVRRVQDGVEVAVVHRSTDPDRVDAGTRRLTLARAITGALAADLALEATADDGLLVITTWPAHV